jgi:hypothetical protein
MASEKIPGALERRHLIERDMPSEKAVGIAEAYLAQGRATEAVIFLEKAGARERLEQLAAEAVEHGDAFLFRAVGQAMGEEPASDRWLALADAADAAGKQRHAESARRWATRGDD